MAEITFTCACGQTALTANTGGPGRMMRLKCYCADCQSFARHLGRADLLDENGGTDLIQMHPGAVRILRGAENLRPLRLSPRGLMRWHATCCNTPIANGLENPKIAFLSFVSANADAPDGAGRVVAKVQTGGAYGAGKPKRDSGAFRAGWSAIARIASARIDGSWRDNPFMDAETGKPIALPIVISKAERAAARHRSA